MSAFTLKMIGARDDGDRPHRRRVFPELPWLRYIGRLSMPIYAFLLAEGYRKNAGFGRYALRLALFAVLSEVPYDLLFQGKVLEFSRQNILFTLLTALLVLRLLDLSAKKRNIFLFIGALLLAAVPYFLHFSYGMYGVLAVLTFFLLQKYRGIDAIAFSALTYGRYLARL